MNNSDYSVTETVRRRLGKIIEIIYDYEENRDQEIQEVMQTKHEHLSRTYQASIKREDYERIAATLYQDRPVLPFDSFVHILRPFMMGSYAADEIEEAFRLLDRNYSNTIDLDELAAFLPVIHPSMKKETLIDHMKKVTNTIDQQINFDEFNQMILRGIGRDIICGHI